MMVPPAPFHFGTGDALFGMYHAAALSPSAAVLLCAPLGQTLIRTHRVYRQLATALAARGIAALRFDYYGTGDSAGSNTDVNWERCLLDIGTAASELRARSGCQRLTVFGAHLGGSLAMAAAATTQIEQLILWDPVLDGAAHADLLDAMQAALREDPLHYASPRSVADAANQWLGFGISPCWREQVTAFRAGPPTVPTTIINSHAHAEATHWNVLTQGGATVTTIQPTTPWDELGRLEHAILSPELIQAVCARTASLP